MKLSAICCLLVAFMDLFFCVVGEEKICLGGANNKEDDTRVLAALGSQAMPSTMKGEIVVKTCSKCSIRGYEHFQ